jgi:hypothetical protein
MNLLNIYLSFAKVGLFTFGGGYAMLKFLESVMSPLFRLQRRTCIVIIRFRRR